MAVFSGFSDKIQAIVGKLRGQGRVTEADVKQVATELKRALIYADVNLAVAKDFVAKVSEKALGEDVLKSLTPGQQVIKIVYEELTELLGSKQTRPHLSPNPPTVFLMAGLQGAGKTTATAKLANYMRKQGHNPLMVACDVYRPAAIQQLQVLGKQLDAKVFTIEGEKNPVKIATEAVKYATSYLHDIVIIDTAGRLQIDEDMMQEMEDIKAAVKPDQIFLVIDSMIGQAAVKVAKTFDERVSIDGVILSKLDGDTRGGAALSVKAVTGKPIYFASVGEKLSDLEPFYPDRMADRILGMGDVKSLIDKAQEAFDEEQSKELAQRMLSNKFTLDDFLQQMQQLKKMGSMEELVSMIPGMNAKALQGATLDESKMVHMEAIIQSMTAKERRNPDLLNASRRKRIAAGSGTTVQEVNRLVNDFENMKKMMKQMTNMTKGKGKKFRGMF